MRVLALSERELGVEVLDEGGDLLDGGEEGSVNGLLVSLAASVDGLLGIGGGGLGGLGGGALEVLVVELGIELGRVSDGAISELGYNKKK